jgi:hypothetical protein
MGGSTGGKAGSGGGGMAGSGGAKDGGGGSTGGSGGTVSVDAGDAKLDVPAILDAPSEANTSCTDDASMGAGQTCNDYCTLFLAICNDNSHVTDSGAFYMNKGDCMSKCNGLSQAALCCRAYHVNNANSNDASATRDTHCPHAAGLALCQ